jgi:hypothetical protein
MAALSDLAATLPHPAGEYYMGTWETLRALLGDVAIEAELRNAYTLRCGLSESVSACPALLHPLSRPPLPCPTVATPTCRWC